MAELGTVLVTGADGFLGRHLVPRLRDDGARVVSALRDGMAGDDTVALDLVAADDAGAVIADVRPDAVVNLAAITDPAMAAADPELAYAVNVIGQLRLIRALLEYVPRARFIAFGTALEYGRPAEPGPITEEALLRPEGVYAATKVAADLQALAFHHAAGLDAVRLRLFNLIGPGRPEAFFPARQVRQLADILDRGAAPIVETYALDSSRDFVDVRDAADAVVASLRRGRAGAAYNVARGVTVPLREVVDRLVALAGREVAVREAPGTAAGRTGGSIVGDATRLRADTGWRPRRLLEDSLRDALAHARAQARGDA